MVFHLNARIDAKKMTGKKIKFRRREKKSNVLRLSNRLHGCDWNRRRFRHCRTNLLHQSLCLLALDHLSLSHQRTVPEDRLSRPDPTFPSSQLQSSELTASMTCDLYEFHTRGTPSHPKEERRHQWRATKHIELTMIAVTSVPTLPMINGTATFRLPA